MASVQGRKSQEKGVLSQSCSPKSGQGGVSGGRDRLSDRDRQRDRQGSKTGYSPSDLFPTARPHLVSFRNLPKQHPSPRSQAGLQYTKLW